MKNYLQYKIGGLLYMPAFQKNIVGKIKNDSIKNLMSIGFCLEDSIRDEALNDAEISLIEILTELKNLNKNLPLIFVRIRNPKHLIEMQKKLSDFKKILTGYILPKFDLINADDYVKIIRNEKIYVMPILETEMIADTLTRQKNLVDIKNILDSISQYVLNIRVGVNDLTNLYGLRRDKNHTTYDIGIIRDILIDILNIFSKDYVVAGSVCNFFDEDNLNLQRELILDRLNGFIGKSAIHISQLKFIFDSLKVSQDDLNDAEQILNWQSKNLGVVKGIGRMNELNCHKRWSERIKILSEIYGVKNDLQS